MGDTGGVECGVGLTTPDGVGPVEAIGRLASVPDHGWTTARLIATTAATPPTAARPVRRRCARRHAGMNRVEVDEGVGQPVGGVLEHPPEVLAHGRSPSASASTR